jgi:hypothetical protein
LLEFITVIVGSASLLLAFGQGHSWGWGSSKVVGLFIIGGISLMLFIVRELSTKTPLFNICVFRNGRYTLSLIITNILTLERFWRHYFCKKCKESLPCIKACFFFHRHLSWLFMPLAGKLYGRARWLMSVGVIFLALGTLTLSWFSIDVSHTYIVFMMTLPI